MEALLDDMREGQISASVVTYNIVVDAFAKEGRLEEVRPHCVSLICRATDCF